MTVALDAPLALRGRRRSGLLGDGVRRFRRNRLAVAALFIVLGLVLVAIFANLIAPYDTSEQFLERGGGVIGDPLAARSTGKFETPSWDHIFGTDQLARDIFSRTIVGLRISLSAALFAILVVTVIATAVGSLAAMGPRWGDDLLMRVTDIAYSFPDLLLIILLSAALGNSIFGADQILGIDAKVLLLFFAISLTAWPTTARLIRGQLLAIRETEYAMAAQAVGASPLRRVFRHMLPNALTPVIVDLTFLVPRAIFAEAALSFIGIGLSPPTPSLGLLINDHFAFVGVQWSALAIPTAVLALLFLAFQFFGDGLRDALDPRSYRAPT